MTKILIFFLFIQGALFPIDIQGKAMGMAIIIQDCEQITKIALEKLVPAFQKNDFENMESILKTIQSTCGENELTERLRILRALVEKKATLSIIADYLIQDYKGILEMRWKSSADKKYAQIYQKHKAVFNFVPLRHAIDSLTKLKAAALLNSPFYTLNNLEKTIVLLFADQVDEVYKVHHEAVPKSVYSHKQKNGGSIYAGVELPWTGMYPLFKSSPTIGLFFSSRLSNPVLVELGMKLRFNTPQKEEFEYLLHDEIEVTYADFSMGVGGTVGIKAFDNDKFIISPKVGLFWEQSSTGLGELVTTYYDDGYDSYEEESVRTYNINTMRTTLALAAMHHLSGRTYIGLEAAYHFVPYNWDKHLVTRVQPQYGSLQLFVRF